jgi:chromate transport protein ChrA
VLTGEGAVRHLIPLLEKLMNLPVYQNLVFSKLAILLAICLAAIGTLSRKELNLNAKKQIVFPLILGFILFFGSVFFYSVEAGTFIFPYTSWSDLAFCICSLLGALLIHTALDNVSKLIRSGLGKDEWNLEGNTLCRKRRKRKLPIR